MKHTNVPIESGTERKCGVRDSVETAIDLAKGLDRDSWERRVREEPDRIPKWGGAHSCLPTVPASTGLPKAARTNSRANQLGE